MRTGVHKFPFLEFTPGPAPQHRTFPIRDSHSTQGHAFANRFSRNRRLLEEEKERLRGHPDDQQESDRHDSQHYERPEMMIIRLAAHRAFFFHATRWYQPESAGGLHRKNLSRDDLKHIPSRQEMAGGFNSARRQELRTACNQDFPGRAANPPNCD